MEERAECSSEAYELCNYGSIQSRDQFIQPDILLQEAIYDSNGPVSRTRRYFSLFIIYVLIQDNMMEYTMYNPSLWPYLTEMDETATEVFLGLIIMSFNIAAAISSPIYGRWYDHIESMKKPLICSNCITISGHLLLMSAEAFPKHRKYVILVARFISGCGYGNYGLLYAYIAMATTFHERNGAMAIRSVFSGLGLFSGPMIQSLFSYIGYPYLSYGPLYLNMYTASSVFCIAINIIEILLVLFVFQELTIISRQRPINNVNDVVSYDRLAASICMIIEGALLFCISFPAILNPPFSMLMFGWTKSEGVRINGIIQAVCGLTHLIGSLFVGFCILKYIKERTIIVFGLLCLVLGFLIQFSWPNLPPLIPIKKFQNISENDAECNYAWCDYTTRINLWQYFLGNLFIFLTYIGAYGPNVTLFSKVLGPKKQGSPQGVYAAAGRTGMAIAPIVCTTTFYYYGPRVTFIIGMLVTSVAFFSVVVMFKRLVPHYSF